MSLHLVETKISKENESKERFEQRVVSLKEQLEKQEASLVEVQVSKAYDVAFFIVEAESIEQALPLFAEEDFTVTLEKEVRLIGESIEEVKRQNEQVNYIVEWNLPAHLTMDQYLARKEKNSAKYSEVPEVAFARTYVCEDMTKCLCFYDAPNQAAVEQAREAVEAPIDQITEVTRNQE